MFLIAGCGDQTPDRPAKLRIGLLPDQSEAALREKYRDIADYLSGELGIPCDLVIASSYEGAVEDFVAGRVDISRFGGWTSLLARERYEVVPLVMREVDRHFSSVFLAAPKFRDHTLADFEGTRLAFGAAQSTSGHLMPRHFLRLDGIVPEEFFSSVTYSGGHDLTALLVQNGKADLGAANGIVVQRMFANGTLDPDRVIVLEETSPYSNYCWMARAELSEPLTEEIRAAFLDLSPLDPAHADLLERHSAGVYLPVRLSDYKILERARESLPPEHPHR